MSAEQELDHAAYDLMVLKVISSHSPMCSAYQLWRGISWEPLGMEYPKGLYPSIERLLAAGLITKGCHNDFPHNVYAITASGRASLESSRSTQP